MAEARVVWRGVTVDKRTGDMLEELARISGDIYIHPTQGSYSGGVSASAGTHDGGGAVDLMHTSWSIADFNTVVKLARKIGFAAWHRTPQQSNWPRHCHLIAVQPGGRNDRGVLSSGAHQQVKDYYDGRNGLANHGRDDGPRDWVGVTWADYYARTHPVHVDIDNLKYGKTNDDVKDLQRALARHMHVDLVVDGQYGPATELQVLRCQRDHGFGHDRPRYSFVGARQAQHLGLKVD